MSERLTDPHPLIAKTKAAIVSQKGDGGRSDAKPDSCLNIAVSSGELPRAYASLTPSSKNGMNLAVRCGSTRRVIAKGTRFEYGDDSVAVVISEEMEPSRRSPTSPTTIATGATKHRPISAYNLGQMGGRITSPLGRW